MTDPITGVPMFAYQGDYSEFAQYDRTDDFMLLQPSSSFGKEIIANFKAQARANGEVIHYLGQGPEGAMYGFTNKNRPAPTPSNVSADTNADYYAYKAASAHDDAKRDYVIPANTPCVLSGVKDQRYKDRMCTVSEWISKKQRYVVTVDRVAPNVPRTIMVTRDALMPFEEMLHTVSADGVGVLRFDDKLTKMTL